VKQGGDTREVGLVPPKKRGDVGDGAADDSKIGFCDSARDEMSRCGDETDGGEGVLLECLR